MENRKCWDGPRFCFDPRVSKSVFEFSLGKLRSIDYYSKLYSRLEEIL